MKETERRLPVGAEVAAGGGVHFRVWAPLCRKVSVVFEGGQDMDTGASPVVFPLSSEPGGYFSGLAPEGAAGMLYRFRLDEEDRLYPDPASRFQPNGPEGPSQIVDPSLFKWTDGNWRGVSIEGQVIYEMHIGAFTREGTFDAAGRHLEYLAKTGITLLQIMPVVDFPGRFGWGYDGVDLFAPTRLYGTPDDFRRFVDFAHSIGLGVILDVVYNHVGPVGNYLKRFSPDYFSRRHKTEWGETPNYDGKNCAPVRELVISNAGYWIDEFHLDGLRLDATQSIFDDSKEHVLKALVQRARSSAKGRSIVIVAENEPQDTLLVRPKEQGGFEMDALLNDDFHHSARVAMTGRNEAYYSDYEGTARELLAAVKWGYLYQGQYYAWQKQCRGTPTSGLKPRSFVNFLQNHDQVANTPRGERLKKLTGPGRFRAMTALLLLSPQTPLIFMGQEFGASSPFHYFADHEGELGKLVREGRIDFLEQFKTMASADMQEIFPDPSDPATFVSSRLDHSERRRGEHAEVLSLHRDLLELRRNDPVFRAQRTDWIQGAVIDRETFVLRFFGEEAGERLILVNLGHDLFFKSISEPLLAPPPGSQWELIWSSEAARYGGNGTGPVETHGSWSIPGQAVMVMGNG